MSSFARLASASTAGGVLRVDVDASRVFGTGPGLFTVLSDIAEHLRSDPAALTADLGRLDVAMGSIHNDLADVRAGARRQGRTRQVAHEPVAASGTGPREVAGIDPPETTVELRLRQVAYEAALEATWRVVTPSLAWFLR